MPGRPLHQQTANLNAGAVTQVYKQQTVGPHQRVSLKDNRCGPSSSSPLPPTPKSSQGFSPQHTALPAPPQPPLRPVHCPLLSNVVVRRGGGGRQPHPGSSPFTATTDSRESETTYLWKFMVNYCSRLDSECSLVFSRTIIKFISSTNQHLYNILIQLKWEHVRALVSSNFELGNTCFYYSVP